MAELGESVINFFTSQDPIIQTFIALLILVTGYIAVRIAQSLSRKILLRGEDLTRKDRERRNTRITEAGYLLNAGVILLSLLYLETGLTTDLPQTVAASLPEIMFAILVFILGAVLIEALSGPLTRFTTDIGLKRLFGRSGMSKTRLNVLKVIVKGALYIILLQVALTQVGLGEEYFEELVKAASWAAAFLLAAAMLYGGKDLLKDFSAGLYLKSSREARPGEEIQIDGDSGEIRDISAFSTTIDMKDGYIKKVQNSEVMKADLKVKKTKSDIETMEDITSHFVAQKPAYCGPAAAAMGLEIFGYRFTQEKIGEKAEVTEEEGTETDKLVESIEELTDEEVKASFVGYDRITDLRDELKAWLNDDALVIANFYKPELFPESTTGHYVLVVKVEGDEVLIMDPSGKKGGVYFVDADDLYRAMGDFGHKRGYIAFAPEGTTAYWRLKNGLIYSEKSYYDEISKTLETRLKKLMRQGRLLKDVTPQPARKYIESWSEERKIDRVWEPDEEDKK